MKIEGAFFFKVSILTVVLLASGCVSKKTGYHKEYNKVWTAMIKSQAWKDAIAKPDESILASNEDALEYLNENTARKTTSSIAKDGFETAYNQWVSRAYFKIISQAENADQRLTQQYKSFLSKEQDESQWKDKTFKNDLALATKQYKAHRAMLEGLKSWNIFSENRTGDLEFFKDENTTMVHQMVQENKSEEQIIGFLVYKLADLYHNDE